MEFLVVRIFTVVFAGVELLLSPNEDEKEVAESCVKLFSDLDLSLSDATLSDEVREGENIMLATDFMMSSRSVKVSALAKGVTKTNTNTAANIDFILFLLKTSIDPK